MKRHAILGLVFIASACTCPFSPPSPPRDALRAELTWEGDADLDLELWSADTAAARPFIGSAADLAGGEAVTGRSGGREVVVFGPPHDAGLYRVGVHFWAPGPDRDTTTTATVTIIWPDGRSFARTGSIDDDSSDVWYPFLVDPGRDTALPLDARSHLGI